MLEDPLLALTDPHIFADLNIERPDDKYKKLKIYILELILYSYEVAYVKMHCMIGL